MTANEYGQGEGTLTRAAGLVTDATVVILSGPSRGNIPMRRFGLAHDIAEAVCFLASYRAGFISGQKLDVDGGYGA